METKEQEKKREFKRKVYFKYLYARLYFVKEMKKRGYTVQEIAETLRITQNKVYWDLNKIKNGEVINE